MEVARQHRSSSRLAAREETTSNKNNSPNNNEKNIVEPEPERPSLVKVDSNLLKDALDNGRHEEAVALYLKSLRRINNRRKAPEPTNFVRAILQSFFKNPRPASAKAAEELLTVHIHRKLALPSNAALGWLFQKDIQSVEACKIGLTVLGILKNQLDTPPNPQIYVVLIEKLCRFGLVKDAARVSREYIQVGYELKPRLCVALATGFEQAGSKALAETFRGFADGVTPVGAEESLILYTGMVEGDGEEAKRVYNRIMSQETTIPVVNAAISVALYHDDYDSLVSAFSDISAHNLSPSQNTYSLAMTAFTRIKSPSNVLQIYQLAESNAEATGQVPNVYSHTMAIKALLATNQPKQALELFNRWNTSSNDGYPSLQGPNLYAYTTLLSHLVNSGSIQQVEDVYHLMGRAGLSRNAVVYSLMMDAYAKAGRRNAVAEMVKRAVAEGKVDSRLYQSIISSHVKYRELRRAVDVFTKMYSSPRIAIAPHDAHIATIITGFTEAKRLAEARQFFALCRRRKMHVGHLSYTALLRGYFRNGYLDRARMTFNRLVEESKNGSLHSIALADSEAHRRVLDEHNSGELLPLTSVAWSLGLTGFLKWKDVDTSLLNFYRFCERIRIAYQQQLHHPSPLSSITLTQSEARIINPHLVVLSTALENIALPVHNLSKTLHSDPKHKAEAARVDREYRELCDTICGGAKIKLERLIRGVYPVLERR